jgi:hypothetical protein
MRLIPYCSQDSGVLGPSQLVEDGEDPPLRGHENAWQALLLLQVIGLPIQIAIITFKQLLSVVVQVELSNRHIASLGTNTTATTSQLALTPSFNLQQNRTQLTNQVRKVPTY